MSVTEDFSKIESYRWVCHSGKHGYPTQAQAEICCDGTLRQNVKDALIAELDKPLFWMVSGKNPTVKVCKECLYGNGHPFNYCPRCPGQATYVRDLGYVPSTKNYLTKAATLQDFNERVDTVYSHLKYAHRQFLDYSCPPKSWDEEWVPYTPEEKETLKVTAIQYEKYCRQGQAFLREYLGFDRN